MLFRTNDRNVSVKRNNQVSTNQDVFLMEFPLRCELARAQKFCNLSGVHLKNQMCAHKFGLWCTGNGICSKFYSQQQSYL